MAAVFLGAAGAGRRLQAAPETLELLRRYNWPGNIRELRNALDHAAAVSSGGVIYPRHLPAAIREFRQGPDTAGALESAIGEWLRQRMGEGADYEKLHDELESALLKLLLDQFKNKPTVLAREMKMNRVTLRKKLRQFFGHDNGDADDPRRCVIAFFRALWFGKAGLLTKHVFVMMDTIKQGGPPAPIRLLLIEDDDDDVFLLRELLAQSAAKFDIEKAGSIAAATVRLAAGGIDLVLSDLSLPDSRGIHTFPGDPRCRAADAGDRAERDGRRGTRDANRGERGRRITS